MGCCVGWVLWVREVLGAVDFWVLLWVGATLTQREKEQGHKAKLLLVELVLIVKRKETAPRTCKEFNEKVNVDICYLLQATTEKNKKRRYHKVFDLTLTMICDHVHRFLIVGA